MHCDDITQIRIAEGTYSPHPEVARNHSFTLREGVQIYGGFQGNEISIAERVYNAYPTVLSGDIGVHNDASDNLYHVLTILSGAIPVILDGITVEDGLANGSNPDQQTGSGIFNSGKLHCNNVILLSNSAPALYNAPGSELVANGLIEVRN